MYNTSEKWKKQIYKNVQSVLNIYIDGELINPDYILDFKVGQTLFDEELTLGSITSKYIELKIYKDKVYEGMKNVKVDYGILINNGLTVAEVNAMLVGTLNGIKVKSLSKNNTSYEMIPIGIFNIDDFTDNDDNTLTLKCIDNMSKFEFDYDGSKLEYPATLLQVLEDICSKAGVELGSTSFLNSNKEIAVYDNTVSAREYLSYISECAGGFAFIGRDGKLYIRSIYQDEQEVSLELFGSYKWGEEYKISKVSYEDGIRSFKFGNEADNTLWINQENMFIVDEEQVKNIYNQVKDLTTNSFEGKVIIDPALDVGDKLIIDGKPVIYQGEANFETRFIADIKSKIAIKQKQETTTKTQSQKVVNRRIQSRIDQAEGKIEQLVEEVGDRSEKKTSITQDVDGITQSVRAVEEKVETVESTANTAKTTAENANTTANTAKSTADTAKKTADNTNNDLNTNYYTKTETNSQITQKAESITSEVSKTYSTKTETSTAKTEAINSANSSTDDKLKNYTETTKLGTAIEQNYEHVKVAWNQISDYIQMMIINNNASFAILDKDRKVMMTLDKTGQHFYTDDGSTVFGEMGVEKEDKQNYISFSVDGEYEKTQENGMAWGIKTKSDGVFHPILYVKDFEMGPKSSEQPGGNLVLEACNLILNGIGTGIVSGDIKISGDPGGQKIYFTDVTNNVDLMTIDVGDNIVNYASIYMLDKISFFKNQAGSNTFRVGDSNNYALLTDEGTIGASGNIVTKGYVYGQDFISDRRVKDDIEDSKANALDIIKKIKHRQFNKKTDNKHYDIGYIAQEMQEIDPNFVLKRPKTEYFEEMYYINQLPIIATLSKAIQEQQMEIEQLELELKKLKCGK